MLFKKKLLCCIGIQLSLTAADHGSNTLQLFHNQFDSIERPASQLFDATPPLITPLARSTSDKTPKHWSESLSKANAAAAVHYHFTPLIAPHAQRNHTPSSSAATSKQTAAHVQALEQQMKTLAVGLKEQRARHEALNLQMGALTGEIQQTQLSMLLIRTDLQHLYDHINEHLPFLYLLIKNLNGEVEKLCSSGRNMHNRIKYLEKRDSTRQPTVLLTGPSSPPSFTGSPHFSPTLQPKVPYNGSHVHHQLPTTHRSAAAAAAAPAQLSQHFLFTPI